MFDKKKKRQKKKYTLNNKRSTQRDTLCSSSLSTTHPSRPVHNSEFHQRQGFFLFQRWKLIQPPERVEGKTTPLTMLCIHNDPRGSYPFSLRLFRLYFSVFFLLLYIYIYIQNPLFLFFFFFTAFAARTFLHFLLHPQAFQKRMAN